MTQGELEKIPLPVQKAMSVLEMRIMEDIVRRIKINGFSTASADWQMTRLQQLGKSEEEVKKYIQESLEVADEEIERIFSEDTYEEYMNHKRAYTVNGMKQIPYEENESLQVFIEAMKRQTADKFRNITGSLGFVKQDGTGHMVPILLSEFYRTTLDDAMYDIFSGAFNYQTVLSKVINDMTKSGLRWIDYESGWHNRVDVAARRAVMTGFRQVQGKINEQTAEKLQTDSYEVTYHVGARPEHQEWQGKVWTMQQLKSICGLGSVTGLHGANCYHDYNLFIPGISVRTYSDEWLELQKQKENTPKVYNGKEYTTYQALQKQRKMETSMRKTRQDIKLLQEGEADEEVILLKKSKYHGQMQNYIDFSNKMELPQQRKRIYQDGLKGQFDLSGAEQKKLEKRQRYDKIKSELKEIGLRGKINVDPVKVNLKEIGFDGIHINQERFHNVDFEEAKTFIKNAIFSETVWNGKFERYYSEKGAAYVDINNKTIRTAFKAEEFSETVIKAMEVMKKYGKK